MNCTICDSVLEHREAINKNGNYNFRCRNPNGCDARKFIAYGCAAAIIPNSIQIAEYWLPFKYEDSWFVMEGNNYSSRPDTCIYAVTYGKNFKINRELIYWRDFQWLYANEFFNDDATKLFDYCMQRPSAQQYLRRKRNYFLE